MMNTLQRFHDAQGEGPDAVIMQAVSELRTGRKQSHWIWFVLPQLRGLGQSAMSKRYGIHDLAEAQAYLADPLLRERLETVIEVISDQLQKPDQSLSILMGSELDAAKTISSLTLFSVAGLASAERLLAQLGRSCKQTLRHLQ